MADTEVETEVKKEESELLEKLSLGGLSVQSSKSCTPTPSSSKVKSETPTPAPLNGAKSGPILIGHLPRAEEDALRTFEVLSENHYQYQTLGRSREVLEGMACDCQYVPGDDPDRACGSDCINRLTQVECLPSDCRCRKHCRNQRMQQKEYADIEVVLTEKKGFGLRAGADIKKDGFIYEYIGDVVNHTSLRKRMRDYAAEGLRHFYFMMLQKDEFIDATRRGGIGRFANHSCNPNCYVAKWTVGRHVRMGIYAKRNIKMHEEITFNYNVDRYGHEAQPCYCGEANCIGVLGGKTQTDVAAMDDATLDALGISDELEAAGPAQHKKIKQRKLGDGSTSLRPMTLKDVPSMIHAMRYTLDKKILMSILKRMKLSEDQNAMRQFMRLRGFTLMANLLEDFYEDAEVCLSVIEAIRKWPLLQRNKIDDSRIEKPIKKLLDSPSADEKLKAVVTETLEHWSTLELGYRIPKRVVKDDDEPSLHIYEEQIEEELQASKRLRTGGISNLAVSDTSDALPHIKPLGKYRGNTVSLDSVLNPKKPETARTLDSVLGLIAQQEEARRRIVTPYDIIASAARAAEEAQRLREEGAAAEQERLEREAEEVQKEAERKAQKAAAKAAMTSEEKERLKENQLKKLIGGVVVKTMSKYREQFPKDVFKKHAESLTRTVVEKEKKSKSYKEGKLSTLSDEKTNKIKVYTKEYVKKLLRRKPKHGHSKHTGAGGSGSGSSSRPTPGARGKLDLEEGEIDDDGNDLPAYALDMGDYDDNDNDNSGDPSPASDAEDPAMPEPVVTVVGQDVDPDVEMSVDHSEPLPKVMPIKIRRPTSAKVAQPSRRKEPLRATREDSMRDIL